MPADKVNWDNVETWQRVLAAVIATGVKVGHLRIAIVLRPIY